MALGQLETSLIPLVRGCFCCEQCNGPCSRQEKQEAVRTGMDKLGRIQMGFPNPTKPISILCWEAGTRLGLCQFSLVLGLNS